jgi:hypothetical protein
VGINYRLRVCRQEHRRPLEILLSREMTRLYIREMHWQVIPPGPHLYGPLRIPLRFNVPGVATIEIRAEPNAPG